MKNYLIEKEDQIMKATLGHIIGGHNISAVFYKNHCLYLDEPQTRYINHALKCGYELLGIIQGKNKKEIERQLRHMTQAL